MKIIEKIREAVKLKKLPKNFNALQVHQVCGILLITSITYLPKHAEGNPGGYKVYFIRFSRGVYKLR